MSPHFTAIAKLLENSTLYYIITTNMEGNYGYINNKYRTNFASLYGEIVGQPYKITMHPDDIHICKNVAAKCFAHPNKTFPAVIRKHDGKGGYIITQWEYKAMFTESGEPDGVFCLGYDITETQIKQKQLLKVIEDLAFHQSLIESIAFDQSHVIRKPVANILGLGFVLERMEIDPKIKEIIDMILKSTRELDQAIKNVGFNKSDS